MSGRRQSRDMVLLVLILMLGLTLGPGLAYLLDVVSYQSNLVTGDDGVARLDVERYRVQAIEAHIAGYGTSLVVLIGTLALFFYTRLRRIDRTTPMPLTYEGLADLRERLMEEEAR